MIIDLIIVSLYFVAVFGIAISGKTSKDITSEEYFLSSRSLRWPSIALSTIATNVQGYQFLGMMGSAYVFGLAQANLEINAVQGLVMAAFIFVPLYLKDKVITITQFIKARVGARIALVYSVSNIVLFSTIGLGAALFWGAYAADAVFGDLFATFHEDRIVRIAVLIVALGVFSAIYTYFGGLSAVVRTDVIQFALLTLGGLIVLFASLKAAGGWSALYEKTPDLMHLHLPADHETLPWTAIFGMFLLNINYWCANQAVMQRSLAARSLKDAQLGLMVGGAMKYLMAAIVILPGIALAGILGDQGLADPDETFPYLVNNFLPVGLRGIIICALFASLMSTIDSTFNSLSTLWSIDIYKEYINKKASDRQLVQAGRNTIIVTLFTGILMGCLLLYVKFENPDQAFTHTLNELRYYINCGIVVLICTAALLITPNHKLVLFGFLSTIPMHIILKEVFPDMNYFIRAMWVILFGYGAIMLPTVLRNGWKSRKEIFQSAEPSLTRLGVVMLLSLVLLHIFFH